MSGAQLRRIVLFNAGRIESADVEIGPRTHFWGPNNRGKTSIISALRFLFIPRVDAMGFVGYKPAETKAYYFSGESSTMIFECQSAANRLVSVVVWHDGALGRNEFERYIFVGGYDPADFLDGDGHVLPHADTLARLGGKGVRRLDPRWIANVVTGIAGDAPPDLPLIGLAPVKSIADYDRFVVIFRNLLNLARLSQDDIKHTFIAINRQSLSRVELQVQRESAEHFAREASERSTIDILAGQSFGIRQAVEAEAVWCEGRRRLPAMYDALDLARRTRKAELEEESSKAQQAINTHGKAIDELEQNIYASTQTIDRLNQSCGGLQNRIDTHEGSAHEHGWRSYAEALEAQAIANLEREHDLVRERIGVGQHEPVETVRRRLARLQEQLARKRHQLTNFTSLLGTSLRKTLDADGLDAAARLLAPGVLHLSVGSDAEITDDARLAATATRLAAVARSGDGREFGLRFDPAQLSAPDVSGYLDHAELEAAITDLEDQVALTQRQLADAEALSSLKEQAERLASDLIQRRERHRAYLAWHADERERLQQWRQELATAKKEVDKEKGTLFKLNRAKTEHVEDREILHTRLLQELRPALERCAILRARRPDWERGTGDSDAGLEEFTSRRYDDMVAFYENEFSRALEKRDLFEALLLDLRRATAGAYDRATPEETLAALEEAHDSLDERRRMHQKTVRDLVVTLRSGASHMLDSLATLELEIKRFNTRLASIAVSDLRSIQIESFRHLDVCHDLQAILSISDDLFADSAKIESLRQLLSNKAYFKLEELFGVQFAVEDGAGKRIVLNQLERNVGSTGTNIAVKVMFCVMLLRGLLKPKVATALPFFIDEAQQLDPANLREIMRVAEDLGFTPLLASPQAIGSARISYPVRDLGNGVSAIPPRGRLLRTELAEETA